MRISRPRTPCVNDYELAGRTMTCELEEEELDRMRFDQSLNFLSLPPTEHWSYLAKFLTPMLAPIDEGSIGIAKLSCRRCRDGRWFRTVHYFLIRKVVKKERGGWLVILWKEVH